MLLLAGAWAAGVGEVTYMTLFAAGALFHRVHREGWSLMTAVLVAVCMVISLDGAMARASLLPGPSPVVAGAVVAGMFGLMSLTRLIGQLPLPAMRFAGLMTYPLYLLHHKIGLAILSMFGSEVPPIVGYALVTALMLALAAGVVLWEKRTTRWWRQRAVWGLDRLAGLVPAGLRPRGTTSQSAAIPPPAASRPPRP